MEEQPPAFRYDYRILAKVIAVIHLVIFIPCILIAGLLIYVALFYRVETTFHTQLIAGDPITVNGNVFLRVTTVYVTAQTVLELVAAAKLFNATYVDVEPIEGVKNTSFCIVVWLVFTCATLFCEIVLGVFWVYAVVPLLLRLICVFAVLSYRRELAQSARAFDELDEPYEGGFEGVPQCSVIHLDKEYDF